MFVISDQIDYLNIKLYQDYEPAIGPKPNFDQRLIDWIENIQEEEDKKLLFRLIPRLFYVGKKEFDTLYRIAFSSVGMRWLIEVNNLSFDNNLQKNLNDSVNQTWFCPITDSMRINQFYHLNGIKGADKRPEWRSLSEFGSTEKLNAYIEKKGFRQIVLLEDFVGSGNQINNPIRYAAKTFPNISFLLVPIIMCPKAKEVMEQIESDCKNVRVRPVIELDPDQFIREKREENESEFNKKVFDLSNAIHPRMRKAGLRSPALGFRRIGGLVVLHTNTPNNSLPLVWSSDDWSPLFNRHVR